MSEHCLKRLQRFFDTCTEKELEDLWLILSAVRGPDNKNHNAKWSFTVPIRNIIHPKMFQTGGRTYPKPPVPYDKETEFDFLDRVSGCMHRLYGARLQEHYVLHIARACWTIHHLETDTIHTEGATIE